MDWPSAADTLLTNGFYIPAQGSGPPASLPQLIIPRLDLLLCSREVNCLSYTRLLTLRGLLYTRATFLEDFCTVL